MKHNMHYSGISPKHINLKIYFFRYQENPLPPNQSPNLTFKNIILPSSFFFNKSYSYIIAYRKQYYWLVFINL